ncbi:hypothetical protein BC826DRAFT_480872 [Russula brevipes]|nr:hypothetical protein BC826DRAFT_480872 [Russula brevipes]
MPRVEWQLRSWLVRRRAYQSQDLAEGHSTAGPSLASPAAASPCKLAAPARRPTLDLVGTPAKQRFAGGVEHWVMVSCWSFEVLDLLVEPPAAEHSSFVPPLARQALALLVDMKSSRSSSQTRIDLRRPPWCSKVQPIGLEKDRHRTGLQPVRTGPWVRFPDISAESGCLQSVLWAYSWAYSHSHKQDFNHAQQQLSLSGCPG